MLIDYLHQPGHSTCLINLRWSLEVNGIPVSYLSQRGLIRLCDRPRLTQMTLCWLCQYRHLKVLDKIYMYSRWRFHALAQETYQSYSIHTSGLSVLFHSYKWLISLISFIQVAYQSRLFHSYKWLISLILFMILSIFPYWMAMLQVVPLMECIFSTYKIC